MKIVLDTNVLLSASFTPGMCEVLLDLCLVSDDVSIVLSEYILDEFTRHAADKFRAPIDKINLVTAALRQRCTIVEPSKTSNKKLRDPNDEPILGTAIAGQAEILVTGDRDLLELGSHEGVAILSPRAFYDRLRK